jgi:hypothetical protein
MERLTKSSSRIAGMAREKTEDERELARERAEERSRAREKKRVLAIIRTFPPIFGLKKMPTRRFRISMERWGFTGDDYQLTVEMQDKKGVFKGFAEASPSELREGIDMGEIERLREIERRLPSAFRLRGTDLMRVMPGGVFFEWDPVSKDLVPMVTLQKATRGYWLNVSEMPLEQLERYLRADREHVPHEEVVQSTLIDGGPIDYRAVERLVGVPFPGRVIPKKLSGEWKTEEGVHIRIIPATGSHAEHRIFVECSCGKWVPLGRFQQHARGQDHAAALARKKVG